jgi:hypothetical protein
MQQYLIRLRTVARKNFSYGKKICLKNFFLQLQSKHPVVLVSYQQDCY